MSKTKIAASSNAPSFTIFDPLPRGQRGDPYESMRCTHKHWSLRGCWLPRGHAGLHDNPNLRKFQVGFTAWSDSDGTYCNTQADWTAHVDTFSKHGSAGPNGTGPDNDETLEDALERHGAVMAAIDPKHN